MELPTSSRMPSVDVAALAANRDPRAHCPGLCALSAFGTPQCPMHLNSDRQPVPTGGWGLPFLAIRTWTWIVTQCRLQPWEQHLQWHLVSLAF